MLVESGMGDWRSTHTRCHLSPCGRGRIASSDAIRVRGYGLSRDLNPSPQPSPTRGEGAHHRCEDIHVSIEVDCFTEPVIERPFAHPLAPRNDRAAASHPGLADIRRLA